MSADVDYASYFLNSRSSIVQLELLEISHPNFTTTYRVVRNMVAGVTVTLETGEVETFSYYPLRIGAKKARDNLDYSINVQLGDLGEVLPTEMDAVAADTLIHGFTVKPSVIYRCYRSDDLTAPLFGPLYLEIREFSFKREGAVFEAAAPKLNDNRTGEIYTFDRFPMLRGFLV